MSRRSKTDVKPRAIVGSRHLAASALFAAGAMLQPVVGVGQPPAARPAQPLPADANWAGGVAIAQPTLMTAQPPIVVQGPPTIADFSLIYIEDPKPRELQVHDLITVIVNEKSEVTMNSRFNRQRNSQLKMELKDFVKIGPGFTLDNAAANSPTIDANSQARINNQGQVTDSEGINYRITATIVDVLPNGNMVLEARKMITTNDDRWEYALTGIVRAADVTAANTVLSEHVADMQIDKRLNGRVFASTKRSWGTKVLDFISPF